jgi:hypothetical protein
MRRLVRHGLVGVLASTCVVLAGVTALGSPVASSASAGPPAASVAPDEFIPVAYVPADPVADAAHAVAAERDRRKAERARRAAVSAEAAYRRAQELAAQGNAIDKQSSEVKAAKKRAAEAAKERAEAAEAEAAAAAEQARLAAIANQGYTPGTTDLREIARQILANKFSYGDDQFACFSWIISRESNWDPQATNRSSGAYGLPQALPGTKMASAGADWQTNPATQIIWGVQYMKTRYGSPCDAKSHWESAGNY